MDLQTLEILTATHVALNFSNPSLAKDYWLCLALDASWPLVVPLLNDFVPYFKKEDCNFLRPFKVLPTGFNASTCFFSPYKNNSFDTDLGLAVFTSSCIYYINISEPIFLGKGRVFVCGDNMACLFLPLNWTGSCIPVMLLPDVDILPGDQPVPLPSFDTFSPRHRRAIQFISLLIGLGIPGALATGSAGIRVATNTYNKLSQRLIEDVNMGYQSVKDLQDQVDSLAEVVL